MSEDCASQEIENSSNSTVSKTKCALTKSILKNGQASIARERKYLLTNEIFPRLPLLEKRDYIENWILSSGKNFTKNSPEKLYPASPVMSVMRNKRAAASPIHGHKWKRARGEPKENSRIHFKEKSRFKERINDDTDSTIGSTYSSAILKCERNSSILNTSRVSRRLSWTIDSKSSSMIEAKTSKFKSHVSTSLSSEIVEEQKVITGNAVEPKNNEKIDDRVTCRFSWHRRKTNGTKRSVELARICDESRVQESLYLSKAFSRTIFSDNAEMKNCVTTELKEDSNVDNLGEITSCSLGITKNPKKAQSPLRWNGYGSEIRKYSKFSDTLSLSPIIDSEHIQSSSSSENDLIHDECSKISSTNTSPVMRKCRKTLQAESPLRWNGYYQGEFRKFSEILELSSPMKESEPMIESGCTSDPKEDSNSLGRQNSKKFEAESPLRWNGYCNERIVHSSSTSDSKQDIPNKSKITSSIGTKSVENFKAKSPLRWNGYRSEIREPSKLPDTVSLSSPLMESYEKTVIQSSSNNEPREDQVLYNQSLLSRITWLGGKKKGKRGIIDHEAIPNISISKNIEVRAKFSSPIETTERIEVESLTTNPPEEDMKIESDSDITVSDAQRENSIERGFKRDRGRSRDSDETYCTNCNPVSQPEIGLKASQRISQLTTNSQDDTRVSRNKSELISQASSQSKNNSEPPIIQVLTTNAMRNNAKRTKKAKKGSLLAKLQNLVSLQASNFQIWQYQMSRPDLKNGRTPFVALTIKNRKTRYGRHYLICTVNEDSYNLLKNLNDIKATATISRGEKLTITLMIIPEISGTLKIREESTVKIYPPWEIIDRGRRVLSIIYFVVDSRRDETDNLECINARSIRNERVLEEFECPCFRGRAIDKSCRVKFTNTKPNVMKTIFASR